MAAFLVEADFWLRNLFMTKIAGKMPKRMMGYLWIWPNPIAFGCVGVTVFT
jgi:hypothetical protein